MNEAIEKHPDVWQTPAPRPLGIVVNPVSGRDARRLFARAASSTHESKRNQIERVIVGAAAAGARRVIGVRDPFRITDSAVEALGVPVEIELLDVGARCRPEDTEEAVRRLRAAGCGAIVVLGGDGTSRVVARCWPDAPMLPLSTGTNNVFPMLVEATVAGAAAGLVTAGRVALADAASRCKLVRIEVEGEHPDLALVDAARLVGDSAGNLLPFDPARLRSLVLARALPSAVGLSPIGGLLRPCGPDDDFGVHVTCTPEHVGARCLLAPISPGLYRKVHVAHCERIELGSRVESRGPGLLAFDGDRERVLAAEQRVWLRVERDGPWVIDPARTLLVAARTGTWPTPDDWHDLRDEAGVSCC